MTEETIQEKMARLRAAHDDKRPHDEGASMSAPSDPSPIKEAIAATPLTQEKEFHVFYNTISSCKMLTDAGRVISFVGGKYITDVVEEIDYLQRELAHPDNIYLSVISGQEVMTAAELDPMKVLRKQHFDELVAMQKEVARKLAAGEPLSQSESEVQALTPGSTADIADLAADSGI